MGLKRDAIDLLLVAFLLARDTAERQMCGLTGCAECTHAAEQLAIAQLLVERAKRLIALL